MKLNFETAKRKLKLAFSRNKKYEPVGVIIKQYTTSSLVLGISILVCYGSSFLKFSFLSLDFSLACLSVLVFKVRYKYILLATILLCISNLMHSSNWVGLLVVSLNNLLFMHLLILFYHLYYLRVKKQIMIHLSIIFFISSVITLLFNVIMNGILYTPLYWYSFNLIKNPSILAAKTFYEQKPNLYLLYIPDYWAGIFTLYTIFNLIKYSVVAFVATILSYISYRTNKSFHY
ncbi:MPN527 family putative ECF transporter permease subunit [Ureaplasma diversum]|uniref:MPN527 family putative ECF transporter permease subunit n=1 Tax=Ureaplasma diversum TaxID=42094 RepID=UPI000AEC2E6B|nr:hypothetical protein [Ureaplasma diversum]